MNCSIFSEKELIIKNRRGYFKSFVLRHGGVKYFFSINKIIKGVIKIVNANKIMPIKKVGDIREFIKKENFEYTKNFCCRYRRRTASYKKKNSE